MGQAVWGRERAKAEPSSRGSRVGVVETSKREPSALRGWRCHLPTDRGREVKTAMDPIQVYKSGKLP